MIMNCCVTTASTDEFPWFHDEKVTRNFNQKIRRSQHRVAAQGKDE
jgi:hypothetical protein